VKESYAEMNRVARQFARGMLHILGVGFCLLMIVGLPLLSWKSAGKMVEDGPRMRVYFVTTRSVPQGDQLTRADIEQKLGHVEARTKVLHSSAIVGRFAVAPLSGGQMVTDELVSKRYVIAAPAGDIVVQVPVESSFTQNIAPDSLLAFTRDVTPAAADEKSTKPIEPIARTLGLPICGSKATGGLRALSISRSDNKDQPSILRVRLDRANANLASELSLFTWRPVILGAEACVAPAPAPSKRKAK